MLVGEKSILIFSLPASDISRACRNAVVLPGSVQAACGAHRTPTTGRQRLARHTAKQPATTACHPPMSVSAGLSHPSCAANGEHASISASMPSVAVSCHAWNHSSNPPGARVVRSRVLGALAAFLDRAAAERTGRTPEAVRAELEAQIVRARGSRSTARISRSGWSTAGPCLASLPIPC